MKWAAMVGLLLGALALPVASWRPIEWSTTETLDIEYKGEKRLYHTVFPQECVNTALRFSCFLLHLCVGRAGLFCC